MSKEFVYTLTKTGKLIYRTVEANYVSREIVDKKVKLQTGYDPRIDKHLIACTIRVVDEQPPKNIGRCDKNKKGPFNANKK